MNVSIVVAACERNHFASRSDVIIDMLSDDNLLLHSVFLHSEHKGLGITSFTLWPFGWDKSMISLHLLVWPLGITPKQLMWTSGVGKGPQPDLAISLWKGSQ